MFSADDLRGVELERVSVTAAIEADGMLRPVGGLWEKLGAQVMDLAQRRLLHTVVVAEGQEDVPLDYLRENADLLRVIRARNIADAVRRLNEQSLPQRTVRRHEREVCKHLDIFGRRVPLHTHYQVLPLLHEVKKERLLRDSHSSAISAESEDGLRPVDILRWEEELQEERVTYERVALEQVFEHFQSAVQETKTAVPRFVVLGPPGSGKTTLEQYLAWRAANGDLHILGRSLVPARLRLRVWEAWALKEREPNFSLADYLAARYRQTGIASTPTAEHWQRWLRHGEVLLLLDGLDEIAGNQSFVAALQTALTTFKDCPTLLTCRTVSFEQHRAVCPDFPVFTLASLENTLRDAYICMFPAEHRDRYDPEALIDQIDRTPQMQPLAMNPLLLSIICYVVDDPRGVSLPATRTELYEKTVGKLLTRPRRVEVRYPGEEPDVDEKRAISERIALSLFAKGRRSLTFTGRELGQELRRALSAEGYGQATAPWANAIRTDLTHNSGILRSGAEQGYFFLHLTVQEFLVAAALARLVNDPGGKQWEAELEVGGKQWTLLQLVGRKAWEPRWYEVIGLLAGQVKNPMPLLKVLSNRKGDDIFLHRLCLAARCLPELSPEGGSHWPSALRDLTQRIGQDVLNLWWKHREQDISFPHIARCLPALAQSSLATVIVLLEHLRNTDVDTRLRATAALGQMGEAVARQPEVLSVLVAGALRDPDGRVRLRAVAALGRMGAAAVHQPEVLTTLVAALRDPDSDMRLRAAVALGQMGEVATHQPEVLAALREMALHRGGVTLEETGGLGWIRQAAHQPEVLTTLVAALREPDRDVR
jgi:hypothetical protein